MLNVKAMNAQYYYEVGARLPSETARCRRLVIENIALDRVVSLCFFFKTFICFNRTFLHSYITFLTTLQLLIYEKLSFLV